MAVDLSNTLYFWAYISRTKTRHACKLPPTRRRRIDVFLAEMYIWSFSNPTDDKQMEI